MRKCISPSHLQSWTQKRVGNVKIQIAVAHACDHLQVSRCPGPTCSVARGGLAAEGGLASLERTIARQPSRVRWLRDGDADTKIFHAVANGRRIKNFIPAGESGRGTHHGV